MSSLTTPASAAPSPAALTMTPRNWATLLALSVLWGGSFLFNALALEGFSVLAVVALRVALAALALWGVILFTGAAMAGPSGARWR